MSTWLYSDQHLWAERGAAIDYPAENIQPLVAGGAAVAHPTRQRRGECGLDGPPDRCRRTITARPSAVEGWGDYRHSGGAGVRDAIVYLPLSGRDLRKSQVVVKAYFCRNLYLPVNMRQYCMEKGYHKIPCFSIHFEAKFGKKIVYRKVHIIKNDGRWELITRLA